MSQVKKEFDFTWTALKLLGKNLYSDAWSAVSELVSNGLDAGADRVSVFIDGRPDHKESAQIQITDNGTGMSDAGLDAYIKVGFDRRQADYENDSVTDSILNGSVMGRKGIGKLAALYLTNKYLIQTKTNDSFSTWKFDASIYQDNSIEKPSINRVSNTEVNPIDPEWGKSLSGTVLELANVNLSGLGPKAFDGLSALLANHFLQSSLPDQHIFLCVATNDMEYDHPQFDEVKKAVAFKNFALIVENYPDIADEPAEIGEIKQGNHQVKIPHTKTSLQPLMRTAHVGPFSSCGFNLLDAPVLGDKGILNKHSVFCGQLKVPITQIDTKVLEQNQGRIKTSNDYALIPYRLTGWIGLHATIKSSVAKENDSRFEKNRFFNPSQIRLYVRNKLAVANILDDLGITQAFVNYIEGEISFDVLDDDLLPDIATSSRQGFDQFDDRWQILKELVRPLVRYLINYRNYIAEELREDEKRVEKTAKEKAVGNFSEYVSSNSEIPDNQKPDVISVMSQQLKGGVEAKDTYKIFLSHKSEDSRFTNFIYKLLEHRNVKKEEFFYTSADDDIDRYERSDSLESQIKANIVSDNSFVVYLTTPAFRTSDYCMFEAGAGWATRGVDDYRIISTRNDDIPAYLSNDRPEVTLYDSQSETIKLDRKTYIELVAILNQLIDHINKAREIKNEVKVIRFPEPQIPDDAELAQLHTTVNDYMDSDIQTYWNCFVENGLDDYISELKANF
ncbi:ATP-binding protein [Bifidobacterium sp. ESL0690]|uniref:ATP-binding protein n=1 Tax=Bifidobacterium sp. ESL0690 TaxID=2983214 RepID=UPI0023F9BAF2|nr:ATP-binding protein [Bifidobacterium sp. ESL0690]WEV47281.1 ATP-binding protein [Bifidobacterium sp. ESL0690]